MPLRNQQKQCPDKKFEQGNEAKCSILQITYPHSRRKMLSIVLPFRKEALPLFRVGKGAHSDQNDSRLKRVPLGLGVEDDRTDNIMGIRMEYSLFQIQTYYALCQGFFGSILSI